MLKLVPQDTQAMLNKVPMVTLVFWVIKILSTTVGETGADLLIYKLHWGLALTSLVMLLPLLAIIIVQLRASRYVPWIYWSTVVMISIVGTLITDNLVDNLGVSLEVTTVAFSVLLALTFFIWHAQEKTLSITSIDTPKRERYYWLAILFTFALGTAAGDLVGESMNLGYGVSALIFAGLIGVVAIAHYVFKLGVVTSFWVIYVLTRPFGASCGDLLSKSVAKGGFGFGTVGTSEIFLVIIVALVVYLTLQDRQQQAISKI
ncbi:MAG TPA: hypothetical protein ENH72_09790 [Pseudomonas sabulinigri]|uniref:Membrane-anchored protein n=1 Tax=marine sediment metagenome TaxID=412755 RepID=A0A0F9TUJ6_9ZZZZ|nr:hypothetical protein [Halopseudomonas sabulinigri]HEC52613.1 hypothetical protein [Halopseudomonas sabulinigri]